MVITKKMKNGSWTLLALLSLAITGYSPSISASEMREPIDPPQRKPAGHAAAATKDSPPANHSTFHATGWAAGAMLGDPTGLSAKHWLDAEHAIDFGLAYALSDYLTFHSDYLVHSSAISNHLHAQEAFFRQTRAYAGIGGAIYFSTVNVSKNRQGFREAGHSVGIAVRIPLGLEWTLKPVALFVEFAPTVGILPSTFSNVGGLFGVRYVFP